MERKMIIFKQCFYTSSKTRRGFGMFAYPESLKAEVKNIEKFCGYMLARQLNADPNAEELAAYPVSSAIHQIHSEKWVFTRSVYVGKDNDSHRLGNIFTHLLVLSQKPDFYPVQLFDNKNITWKKNLPIENDNIETAQKWGEEKLNVELRDMAECFAEMKSFLNEKPDRITVLQDILKLIANNFLDTKNTKKILIQDSAENIEKWMYVITSSFPIDLSLQIPFISYAGKPHLYPQKIVGVIKEADIATNDTYKYETFDLLNPIKRKTLPASLYADKIVEIWQTATWQEMKDFFEILAEWNITSLENSQRIDLVIELLNYEDEMKKDKAPEEVIIQGFYTRLDNLFPSQDEKIACYKNIQKRCPNVFKEIRTLGLKKEAQKGAYYWLNYYAFLSQNGLHLELDLKGELIKSFQYYGSNRIFQEAIYLLKEFNARIDLKKFRDISEILQECMRKIKECANQLYSNREIKETLLIFIRENKYDGIISELLLLFLNNSQQPPKNAIELIEELLFNEYKITNHSLDRLIQESKGDYAYKLIEILVRYKERLPYNSGEQTKVLNELFEIELDRKPTPSVDKILKINNMTTEINISKENIEKMFKILYSQGMHFTNIYRNLSSLLQRRNLNINPNILAQYITHFAMVQPLVGEQAQYNSCNQELIILLNSLPYKLDTEILNDLHQKLSWKGCKDIIDIFSKDKGCSDELLFSLLKQFLVKGNDTNVKSEYYRAAFDILIQISNKNSFNPRNKAELKNYIKELLSKADRVISPVYPNSNMVNDAETLINISKEYGIEKPERIIVYLIVDSWKHNENDNGKTLQKDLDSVMTWATESIKVDNKEDFNRFIKKICIDILIKYINQSPWQILLRKLEKCSDKNLTNPVMLGGKSFAEIITRCDKYYNTPSRFLKEFCIVCIEIYSERSLEWFEETLSENDNKKVESIRIPLRSFIEKQNEEKQKKINVIWEKIREKKNKGIMNFSKINELRAK